MPKKLYIIACLCLFIVFSCDRTHLGESDIPPIDSTSDEQVIPPAPEANIQGIKASYSKLKLILTGVLGNIIANTSVSGTELEESKKKIEQIIVTLDSSFPDISLDTLDKYAQELDTNLSIVLGALNNSENHKEGASSIAIRDYMREIDALKNKLRVQKNQIDSLKNVTKDIPKPPAIEPKPPIVVEVDQWQQKLAAANVKIANLERAGKKANNNEKDLNDAIAKKDKIIAELTQKNKELQQMPNTNPEITQLKEQLSNQLIQLQWEKDKNKELRDSLTAKNKETSRLLGENNALKDSLTKIHNSEQPTPSYRHKCLC